MVYEMIFLNVESLAVNLHFVELRQRQVAQRSPPGSQLRPGVTPGYPGMTPMRPRQQGSGVRPGMTPFGPRGSAQGMQPRNIMSTPHVNGKYHTTGT